VRNEAGRISSGVVRTLGRTGEDRRVLQGRLVDEGDVAIRQLGQRAGGSLTTAGQMRDHRFDTHGGRDVAAQVDDVLEREIHAQGGASGRREGHRRATCFIRRVHREAHGGARRVAAGSGGQDHSGIDTPAHRLAAFDADHRSDAQVRRVDGPQQVGQNVLKDAHACRLGGQPVLVVGRDQELAFRDPGAQIVAVQVLGQLALDIGPDVSPLVGPPVAGPLADGLDADDVDGAARHQIRASQALKHRPRKGHAFGRVGGGGWKGHGSAL